jgi:hypothetical protein
MLTDLVSFSLNSLDKAHSFELENAFFDPKINLSHTEIHWPAIKHQWSHLAQLNLTSHRHDISSTLVDGVNRNQLRLD